MTKPGFAEHERIWLSPPHISGDDKAALAEVLDSNWIAPVGPHLARFEHAFSSTIGVAHACAVTSGTAALHLALLVLGVQTGDEVLVSDLTFAASANAVRYVGATPVFIDADEATWNLDPDLLLHELERRARHGKLPAAIIAVDLYGQVADFERLRSASVPFGVPIVEDAAEALGATYKDKAAGSLGDIGIFSFNGNKIITTSGGGMLTSENQAWVDRARHLATQAREPLAHYEHLEVGYNYRLSNVLAALGCSQLKFLAQRVDRRREIHARYEAALSDAPGVTFMPRHSAGSPSWWLTCLTVDSTESRCPRDDLIRQLGNHNIEARPVWKPMHLQPVFRGTTTAGGAVSERIFRDGLCLPSGSSLTDSDLERIIGILHSALH